MINWEPQITFLINGNVNFSREAIHEGFSLWENVAEIDFVETSDAAKADLIVADLDEVKAAFGLLPQASGLNVTITDAAGNGVKSYVGLNQDEIFSFDLTRVAAHEIGHAFGFIDKPGDDPHHTIYSYHGSHEAHLEAEDIEAIQRQFGASSGNNEIHAGEGSGTVFGGAGNDTIHADGGDDIVYGNQGDDVLYGDAGNDRMNGGQGDDVLYGGDGDDVFASSLGNDTIDGGEGFDTLELRSAPTEVSANGVVGEGYDIDLIGVEKVQYGNMEWLL